MEPVILRHDRFDYCFVVKPLTAEEFFATRFDGKVYYDMDVPDRPKVLNTQYEYDLPDEGYWADTCPTGFARITCRGR